MKSSLIKSVLASALITVLVGASTAQSISGAAVSTIPSPVPPSIGFIAGTADGPTIDFSLNGILNSMNLTVNTKLADLGMYLHGNENAGNGLIELLMSMNSKLGQQVAQGTDNLKSSDMADRRRMYDQGIIQDALARGVAMDGSSMRNLDASCSDATFSAGAAQASVASAQVAQINQAVLTQNISSNRTGADRLGSIIGQHLDYCDAEDIKNKRAGCESQGESDMPNADVSLSSVYQGAVKPGTPTSGTLNAKQQKAALAYVNSILPVVPQDAPSSLKDTPSGRVYQANLTQYRARTSGVVDGFATDIALHAEPGSTKDAVSSIATAGSINMSGLTSGGFGADGTGAWSSTQTKWKKLFGTSYQWSANPSEWDVLKYDVFSRYADADPADPQSWNARVASFTEQQALQELNRQQALTNRLNLMVVEQLQENNRLQRLRLANELNPLTAEQLAAQRAALTQN